MRVSVRTLLLSACAVSIAVAAPAMAKPGKDKGKGRGADDAAVEINIGLGDSERRVVRDYYSSRSDCPPGLAKKNNGCLPPGIAKKRYEIGRPVFDDAIVVELPHDIILRLPPLDRGYGYRMVDGDLVVVTLATMVVLDAIGVF